MPQASRSSAARTASGPGYEGRFDELGDYTVAFEQFSDGGDMTPLFRGLLPTRGRRRSSSAPPSSCRGRWPL